MLYCQGTNNIYDSSDPHHQLLLTGKIEICTALLTLLQLHTDLMWENINGKKLLREKLTP